MLLIAPAHSADEIVEPAALALGFPHDKLGRIQFYHVELQPLAARREMDGQVLVGSDEPEMLRHRQHRFAALELAAATHIRPRLASLQRDIHDFPAGVGRMRLHKGFGARRREVAIHLDRAIKPSGITPNGVLAMDASDAGGSGAADASDAVAAAAFAVDGGAAITGAKDADAARAADGNDPGAAAAEGKEAGAAAAEGRDAGAARAAASDANPAVTAGIHAVGPVGAGRFDRGRAGDAAGEVPRAAADRARHRQGVVQLDVAHEMARQAAAAGSNEAGPTRAGSRDPGAAITSGIHAVGPIGAGRFDGGRAGDAAGKDARFDAPRSQGCPTAQLQHRSCSHGCHCYPQAFCQYLPATTRAGMGACLCTGLFLCHLRVLGSHVCEFLLWEGMCSLQLGQPGHKLVEDWLLRWCAHWSLLSWLFRLASWADLTSALEHAGRVCPSRSQIHRSTPRYRIRESGRLALLAPGGPRQKTTG